MRFIACERWRSERSERSERDCAWTDVKQPRVAARCGTRHEAAARTLLALALSSVAAFACSDEGAPEAASTGGSGGGAVGGSAGRGGAGTAGMAQAGASSGGRSGAGSGGASSGGASSGGRGGGAGGANSAEQSAIDGCSVFPRDNPWNQDVSAFPLHAQSDAFIDSIGRSARVHPDFGTEWEGAPIGIPFVAVGASQANVAIEFTAYGDESDPGPYPVPADAPIEGGPSSDGDRHVLVIDTSSCKLYELYRAFSVNGGRSWEADSGAVFDLTTNDEHPFSYTSADAAGLPIFPGLVRYEEVVEIGELRHAVRFTVDRSQAGLIAPARHYASSSADPKLPPMGLRLRMKAGYDCSGYSSEAKVVCAGLKRYGMIVADNGSNWYLSGAPDPRWNDEALGDLKQIPGDAFEVVDTGPVQTY